MAVCGAGKTEMLFPGITETLKLGMRICIATPRADVVRELKPRLQQAFQQVTVQALYGGSKDKDGTAQLMLATTHQLLRMKEAFDMMIIDEIDAFPFHADPSLPFAANRAKKSASTTIYLTATPRNNHQKQIQQKKLPHIFVPVRYHGHALPVPKLKMSRSLQKDLQKNMPPSSFVFWLKKRKNQDRQLLIFVPTITLAEKLLKNIAEVLLKEKVIDNKKKIDFVHAEDSDRTEKVMHFREKELTVIITTTILERGVTFPSVDVAIFDAGHEVFDEAALVQIAGRAGRSADDPTGEVVFFHDGKTEAMVRALNAVKQMNKRGGCINMHCLWCFDQITPQMNWQNIVVLFKPKSLCNQCEEKLDKLVGKRCSRCSRIAEEEVCSDCIWWQRHTGRDILSYNHSIYTYSSFMQDVIAKWKYRGDFQLGNVFKQPLIEAYSHKFSNLKPVVVPIPLSEERLTERGFNQAKMMADFLPAQSEEALKRVHGEKQSKKTRNERIFTDNPFILTKPIKKPVILVDDIYTTGTTIRHAAALLKKHGTPEIFSLTLIRG